MYTFKIGKAVSRYDVYRQWVSRGTRNGRVRLLLVLTVLP